jgi:hypothetical protein
VPYSQSFSLRGPWRLSLSLSARPTWQRSSSFFSMSEGGGGRGEGVGGEGSGVSRRMCWWRRAGCVVFVRLLFVFKGSCGCVLSLVVALRDVFVCVFFGFFVW